VKIWRTATPYRHNWALFDKRSIGNDTDMIVRYRLIRVPWFGIFIHNIKRPDTDRNPHDHPWWFASFVLKGWYIERLNWYNIKTQKSEDIFTPDVGFCTALIKRSRFSLHQMKLDHAHMITDVSPNLWTLVFVGKRKQEWGFWTPKGWVHQQKYISTTGQLGPDPFDS
jgi:hypothetical protein